jgi:hypothetical protein
VRYALFVSRMIFYALVGVISLAAFALVILKNWEKASPGWGENSPRLTLHATASRKIRKGARVKDEDVTWAISRLRQGESGLPKRSLARGKYAVTDIAEGSALRPGLLSDFAPVEAPQNGAAIPVEVKTDHAVHLVPGMRIAFLKDNEMLPKGRNPDAGENSRGFLLLSITGSVKDESLTTLTVQVPPAEMVSLSALGSNQWRPVVLGQLNLEPDSEQVPLKGKTERAILARRSHGNGPKAPHSLNK